MPFNSNGIFSLVNGYLGITGQTIQTSQHNPPLEDIASGLSSTFLRTGVAPMLADLPMGGFKVTGMAAGVASTDAATIGQTSALATAAITGAALKATPVDADTIPLVDSAAGNTLKRITWANLRALFQPASSVLSAIAAIGTAVSGDIIYGTGAGTWGRRAKGTDGQFLSQASGVPAWATLPFSKQFESSQLAFDVTASTVVAHGLGVKPKLYAAFLVNVTAEFGFVPGDEVPVNSGFTLGQTPPQNNTLKADATNLTFAWSNWNSGSPFAFTALSNFAQVNITAARWRMILRAWA